VGALCEGVGLPDGFCLGWLARDAEVSVGGGRVAVAVALGSAIAFPSDAGGDGFGVGATVVCEAVGADAAGGAVSDALGALAVVCVCMRATISTTAMRATATSAGHHGRRRDCCGT
jgi:hypothetical protein